MPIKYAIANKRSEPLTKEEQTELEALGYYGLELNLTYEEVPAVAARLVEKNGVYAIFSTNGRKISKWLLLKKPAELQKLLQDGKAMPGTTLYDSIGQDINQGDYVFTHSHDHKRLELGQVVKNAKAKTFVECLSDARYCTTDSEHSVRPRNTEAHIRIPLEMIEGGMHIPEQWEKRYCLMEFEFVPYKLSRVEYLHVDEATARQAKNGHFGYFNKGELITGWIPFIDEHDQKYIDGKVHASKKIMDAPPAPFTDAMGTDIRLGDFVFSDNNQLNTFILGEVIGFTKDKVWLMSYKKLSPDLSLEGHRIFTLNWPKNIIKLPIEII